MTWKPIVAGVDASPQGTRAAVVAARLAETAGTTCYLAHAVRDPFTDVTMAQVPMDLSEVGRIVRNTASMRIRNELQGKVPPAVLDRLDVRLVPSTSGGVVASVSPASPQGTVVPAGANVQMMLPSAGQGDETTGEEPVATGPTMPTAPIGSIPSR